MRVQCPNCGVGGNLPDDKIPPQGTKITCPKCSTAFVVTKQAAQSEAQGTDSHYQEGVRLLKQRQVDAAVEQFNLAIQQDPQHAGAYRYLGLAYGQKNLWTEAIQVLQKAVSFQADDVQSLKNLGVAYLKQNHFAEAVQVLEQALQYVPNDSKAKSYYEMASKKFAEQQQAEQQQQEQLPEEGYDDLQGFAPPDESDDSPPPSAGASKPSKESRQDPVYALLDKGVECLDNGQYKAAIEAFDEAIRLSPSSSSGHFGLGMVYEKRGDWGEAINAYEQALELDPNDSAARESLKFAKKQQKKFRWKFWKK
jgi:predicted Zn finger-like uncharacterized protein